MAVVNKAPVTLAKSKPKAMQADAIEWAEQNSEWLRDILEKHNAWLAEAQVDKYQAAYDGDLEEIELRDKAKGDNVNYKLVVNYAQLIIDTVVDYMIGRAPTWTVEDNNQADKETKDAPIVTEYRKELTKLLKTEQAQRVLAEQLRQGSIAYYSGVICWVDEDGAIDYEEFPVQEIIPILDVRGRLKMVIHVYDVEELRTTGDTKTRKKVEIYDDRYVTYLISDEEGVQFVVDPDEAESGNPIEHKAGRIPVSLFFNASAAGHKKRTKRVGTSDLGTGVYDLLVAYSHGISDKANLADYLQDQYLKLKGVDVDENEVLKMKKARAIALKSKDSDAEFIAQSQEDTAVENYLNRLENSIYDTTFTPKLNKLEGATATEIKMKYAALDIKAGKKEIYFRAAIVQLINILTDLLNAKKLSDQGNDSPYDILRDPAAMEARDDLYNANWVTCTLNRNLPQNYKEIADIVAVLSGKIPDTYLYELLWFVEDPVKALAEMKAQRAQAIKENIASMGYDAGFQDTGEDADTNTDTIE